MTGNALEYFNALAKCWPPHPVAAVFCGLFLTRMYSIRHCLSRIKLGILMMIGTMYFPPHPLSGLSVEDFPEERNMHSETNRSPSTFAYEVRASASRISPNLPSCASAIPPMLIRFRVVRNRWRPWGERRL